MTSSIGGIGGLASGIDWTVIIQQLMSVEQRPLQLLGQKESTLNRQLTAMRDVNSRLLSLKASAASLASSSAINGRTATVNGQALTASAGPAAATGTHRVTVYRLATATRASSTGFLGEGADAAAALADAGLATAPSTGTFSINNMTITIDSLTTLSSGANSVTARINAAVPSIVATIEKDSGGRDNLLKLYAASGSIQLGSSGDTSNILQALKVRGADPRSTWTGGAAESLAVEGTIAADISADATVSFSYGGASYVTSALAAATSDVTTLADIASDLQAKMNSALGAAGSVTVAVDDRPGAGDGRFVITDDRTGGNLAVTSLAGADTTGLASLLAAGGATLGETIISTANVAGAAAGKRLYEARLATLLEDAMQSGYVESSTAAGKAGFSLDGTETVTFDYHGSSFTTAALAAAAAGVTDLSAVAADLQAKMNAEIGAAGSVTVSVLDAVGAGNARFIVTDDSPTGGGSMSFGFTATPAALRLQGSEGAAAGGAFKVNGVAISYDKYSDTLNTVISRVNSSAANVTAQYDAMLDRLVITSKATGGATVLLEDVGGNFLSAAMIDDEAGQALGVNARFSIDDVGGGAVLTSDTNVVSTVVPGLTLTLSSVSETDTLGAYVPTTVTVAADTEAAVSAVNSFVSSYNAVLQSLATYASYDPETKTAGTLNGNSAVRAIVRNMRSLVGGTAEGLAESPRTLMDVGISFGAGGTLTVDTEDLRAALRENPERVSQLFGGYAGAVTLQPGGTGGIQSVTGQPTRTAESVAGTYRIVSDAGGNLEAWFTPAGGPEVLAGTGTITAGGTNTTLIPGVTIRAKSVLAAGENTLTKTANLTGVVKKLELYLEASTSSTGVISNEQNAMQRSIKSLQDQAARIQSRLDLRQQTLQRQFSMMETLLSRMQSQSTWLTTQIQSLSNNWQTNGG